MLLLHELSVMIDPAVASTDACVLPNFSSTDARPVVSRFPIDASPVLRSVVSFSISFSSPSILSSRESILSEVAHRV